MRQKRDNKDHCGAVGFHFFPQALLQSILKIGEASLCIQMIAFIGISLLFWIQFWKTAHTFGTFSIQGINNVLLILKNKQVFRLVWDLFRLDLISNLTRQTQWSMLYIFCLIFWEPFQIFFRSFLGHFGPFRAFLGHF